MDSKRKCCEISTMCGYSLHHGVVFIGTISTFVSIIILAEAMLYVMLPLPYGKTYNGQPVIAFNMIFGLYSMSVSLYQIVISLLLIWQAVRTKGDIFLCTLWTGSHAIILSLYCLLFSAKTFICLLAKQYFSAFATALAGLTYKAIFIYFSVVVNSFSYTIDDDIYC